MDGTYIVNNNGGWILDENGNYLLSDNTSDCECCSGIYRQARSCDTNNLVSIWMTNTNATSYSGMAFTITSLGVGCNYFNFTDPTTGTAGMIYTSTDVGFSAATCSGCSNNNTDPCAIPFCADLFFGWTPKPTSGPAGQYWMDDGSHTHFVPTVPGFNAPNFSDGLSSCPTPSITKSGGRWRIDVSAHVDGTGTLGFRSTSDTATPPLTRSGWEIDYDTTGNSTILLRVECQRIDACTSMPSVIAVGNLIGNFQSGNVDTLIGSPWDGNLHQCASPFQCKWTPDGTTSGTPVYVLQADATYALMAIEYDGSTLGVVDNILGNFSASWENSGQRQTIPLELPWSLFNNGTLWPIWVELS